jgi:hypothetical protein
VRYLYKTGTMKRLQEAANKYGRRLQKHPDQRLPFLFLLELDIVLLSDISGKLREKYKQLGSFSAKNGLLPVRCTEHDIIL